MSLRHFGRKGGSAFKIIEFGTLLYRCAKNKNDIFKKGSSYAKGPMVSTLDSESSDPSSNLGGTYNIFFYVNVNIELLFFSLRKVT